MAVLPAFYISTFSGIGALDVAIGRVLPETQCLLYVEREIPAVATLAARMEAGDLDAAPVWGDVRTVPTDHLRGRVNLVVGGFPCQDISSAGKRTGILGSRSGLFFDLVRLVRDVGAEYVFLENVAALTVRGLDTVLGALAEIGFAAEWGCLRASDAGAPHGRDRWWCLAWDRQQLADTDGGRQRPDVGDIPDGISDALGGNSPVADPLRLQRTGRGPEVRDGRGVREVRQAVGDPERLREPAGLPAPAGRHGIASEPTVAHHAGERLADANRRPCEPEDRYPSLRGWAHDTEQARMGSGRVPYPPGPTDRDGWATYLDAYPNLAPAIESAVRRGTDGPATRVDRLRGLGNAVVPDQAEWALRLLWFRAFGEWPS